jgi:hypothetical protein
MWFVASSLRAKDSHNLAVEMHNTFVQNTISTERSLVKTISMVRPIVES